MATAATIPSPPPDVAAQFQTCPSGAMPMIKRLRELIFTTADALPDCGRIVECLKWGEPAYLTEAPKSGTTLRLGWDETGSHARLFVPCQTTLIGHWRERYGDTLSLVGNREVSIPTGRVLPIDALRHCIAMVLTYHVRKAR